MPLTGDVMAFAMLAGDAAASAMLPDDMAVDIDGL